MLILRGSNKTMELRDSLGTFLLPRFSAWSCLKMRDRWCIIQFSSVQSLSHIWLFDTPRLQHARLPCPSPTPGARSNSCPSSQWRQPTISSSVVPFSSCLQSFPTQTLPGRSGSVSVGPSGVHKVLFEPSKHLWWVWGLILNAILLLLPSFLGFSFALGPGVSFFGGIQHSPVDGFSPVSCNFGVLTGEDEHTSFYSSILQVICTDLSNQHQILLHSLRRQMGKGATAVKFYPWNKTSSLFNVYKCAVYGKGISRTQLNSNQKWICSWHCWVSG